MRVDELMRVEEGQCVSVLQCVLQYVLQCVSQEGYIDIEDTLTTLLTCQKSFAYLSSRSFSRCWSLFVRIGLFCRSL